MSAPPVPFLTRQRFEAEVRVEVTRAQADNQGRYVSPDLVCQVAQRAAEPYPWADDSTVANTLVDILGIGWGATYCHWAWEQEDGAAA